MKIFLLEAYCKVIQEACGSKYDSVFGLLNQHHAQSNGNLLKSFLQDILTCLLVFKKHAKFALYVTNYIALVWRILIFQSNGQEKYYDLCMFCIVFTFCTVFIFIICDCGFHSVKIFTKI